MLGRVRTGYIRFGQVNSD